MEKISSKDPTTQRGYKIGLNNFDSFCLDKYGKIDCILDLKKGSEEDVFNFLQSWINWNNSLAPRTVTNYFSKIKNPVQIRNT